MRRFAFVLGAGGALAWAYHLGVVEGLRASGFAEPERADRLVGTSGGAVIAAALVAGTRTDDFLAAVAALKADRVPAAAPAKAPRAPEHAGPGSTRPLERVYAAALRLFPEGVFSTGALRSLPFGHADAWHDPRLWITAVRARDGVTVVFGRDTSAPTIGDAVEASCAVPTVFAPKLIDGEHYVDGAVASSTHADLLRDEAHELTVVSAPMARPGGGLMRVWARYHLAAELERLRRAGRETLVFTPDARVVDAAQGYPYDRRDTRDAIVEAARRQVLEAVRG